MVSSNRPRFRVPDFAAVDGDRTVLGKWWSGEKSWRDASDNVMQECRASGFFSSPLSKNESALPTCSYAREMWDKNSRSPFETCATINMSLWPYIIEA